MDRLFESFRLYLKEDSSSSKETIQLGSNEIVVNTIAVDGGKIVVWENSPYAGGAHSIYKWEVDEDSRGQGIGSKLIDVMMRTYPGEEISAQVSSMASLKVLYNKGFRPGDMLDVEFEELTQAWEDEGGSLNLRYSGHG